MLTPALIKARVIELKQLPFEELAEFLIEVELNTDYGLQGVAKKKKERGYFTGYFD